MQSGGWRGACEWREGRREGWRGASGWKGARLCRWDACGQKGHRMALRRVRLGKDNLGYMGDGPLTLRPLSLLLRREVWIHIHEFVLIFRPSGPRQGLRRTVPISSRLLPGLLARCRTRPRRRCSSPASTVSTTSAYADGEGGRGAHVPTLVHTYPHTYQHLLALQACLLC